MQFLFKGCAFGSTEIDDCCRGLGNSQVGCFGLRFGAQKYGGIN